MVCVMKPSKPSTTNFSCRVVFNQANQCNGHQAAALAGSLYAYAAHIDDLGVLSPAMERISQKHSSLYIQPEQYVIVGTYLLQAMKKVLGDDLTPEIHDAYVTLSEYHMNCGPRTEHY